MHKVLQIGIGKATKWLGILLGLPPNDTKFCILSSLYLINSGWKQGKNFLSKQVDRQDLPGLKTPDVLADLRLPAEDTMV